MAAAESLDETRCRALAALLGHSVSKVLWPHYQARIRARDKGAKLTTRVGSGRATYHRASKAGAHLIVFGWKMVQQKSRGWRTASRWTSGREMATRGYFGERVDLLSVLAHAACHEFAHLIQTVEGKRRPGSVHNQAFYSVLDEMHQSGVAGQVLDLLADECRHIDLEVNWLKGALEDVRPGDAVRFMAHGERITGRVRRVNRCTVTIVPDRPKRPGQYWRVAPGLFERL